MEPQKKKEKGMDRVMCGYVCRLSNIVSISQVAKLTEPM